jgi:hypothetical protein
MPLIAVHSEEELQSSEYKSKAIIDGTFARSLYWHPVRYWTHDNR